MANLTQQVVDYSEDEHGLSYPTGISEEEVQQPERRSQMLTPDEARNRFSFQMPLWASTRDTLLPSDDPSYYTYQGSNGVYYVPSFYSYEDRLEEPRSFSEGVDKLKDYIPSRTEVESALLGLPSYAYGVVDRLVGGEGTLGDVWEAATVPALGVANMPRRAVSEALDGEILPPEPRAGLPAAQRQGDLIEGEVVREPQALPPPRQDQGNLTATDAELDELFRQQPFDPLDGADWNMPDITETGALRPINWQDISPSDTPYPVSPTRGNRPDSLTAPLYPNMADRPEGFNLGSNIAVYRSPIAEIASATPIPSKGLKGSQFVKSLRDNPTVRAGELAAIQAAIEPNRRYTREELDQIVQDNTWTVQAVNYGNEFETYQRQMVRHDQLDYVEIGIDASNPSLRFQANSQHFGDNTLAHTRLSLRENEQGRPYVLVEELQSDLVQQGWVALEAPTSFSEFAIQQLGPDLTPEWSFLSTIYKVYEEPLTEMAELLREGSLTRFKAEKDIGQLVNLTFSYLPEDAISHLARSVRVTLQDYNSSASNPAYASIVTPPVTNVTDSTRLAIEAAMAYAARNGADEVVIPPFEQIVARRFEPGTEEYSRAIKEGSGFHQTYVTAVQRVLRDMEKEFGRDFSVRSVDLPYPESRAVRINYDTLADDISTIRYWQAGIEEPTTTQIEQLTNRYGEGWRGVSNSMELHKLAAEFAPKANTQGIAINISNLRDKYDLELPRFAEGGLVTQTQEAFYA